MSHSKEMEIALFEECKVQMTHYRNAKAKEQRALTRNDMAGLLIAQDEKDVAWEKATSAHSDWLDEVKKPHDL